jgi:hypothetical protein
MPEDRNILSDRMARKLQNIEKFVDNFTVTGDVLFKKTGTSCSIHVRPVKAVVRATPSTGEELTAQYDGMVAQSGADLVVSMGYLRLVNGPAT